MFPKLVVATAVIFPTFALGHQAVAQSSIGSCHMQAEGALFQSKTMTIKMQIADDGTGTKNVCTLDLKTVSLSTGSNVQGRGSRPIEIAKADLKISPTHGTVDREDVSINYRGKRGFRGTDRFTVVVSGRHADHAGSTAINFVVAIR